MEEVIESGLRRVNEHFTIWDIKDPHLEGVAHTGSVVLYVGLVTNPVSGGVPRIASIIYEGRFMRCFYTSLTAYTS